MKALVAYPTRHGATTGIAERIARTLNEKGIPAEALPVDDVRDVTAYDAVVLGSVTYMFHWLKEATRFARRHREELAARPVWPVSSGPLGTDLVDDQGRDVRETSRPKEFDELTGLLGVRGERVFFGAYDAEAAPIGVTERAMRHLPAAKDMLPSGDFRDWTSIESWAGEIAAELSAIPR
jgi:menaquinone-dependent protoporphyrinogen oxidase